MSIELDQKIRKEMLVGMSEFVSATILTTVEEEVYKIMNYYAKGPNWSNRAMIWNNILCPVSDTMLIVKRPIANHIRRGVRIYNP